MIVTIPIYRFNTPQYKSSQFVLKTNKEQNAYLNIIWQEILIMLTQQVAECLTTTEALGSFLRKTLLISVLWRWV